MIVTKFSQDFFLKISSLSVETFQNQTLVFSFPQLHIHLSSHVKTQVIVLCWKKYFKNIKLRCFLLTENEANDFTKSENFQDSSEFRKPHTEFGIGFDHSTPSNILKTLSLADNIGTYSIFARSIFATTTVHI